MALAEAIEDLTNTDMSNKCSIPEVELSYMNTSELARRANAIAGELAHEINRFTEGFILLKPPRPVQSEPNSDGTPAPEPPPEDPTVRFHII